MLLFGAGSFAIAGPDMPKDSQLPQRPTAAPGIRDRSKTILRQRAEAPIHKGNGSLFWAARLPWTPNAPGD